MLGEHCVLGTVRNTYSPQTTPQVGTEVGTTIPILQVREMQCEEVTKLSQ